MKTTIFLGLAALLVAPCPALAAGAEKEGDTRCFELRICYAAPGKLDALHRRFRDHTCKLFEKHGMRNLGYWVPVEKAESMFLTATDYSPMKW